MAIVGANGSGKTTLAKLLCDLLPPTRGTISWDGVDLAGCDPALVRAQIAPVFQDFARYMLTIRQAIGLGDVERLDDEAGIRAAAHQAGIEELIDSHPSGLDTRLGKVFSGGIDLSVGQWQRLAIARALFRDAPVVVLDEPSASLDPRAEADLFDLLHSLCDDRIVVFVSHRFATVRSADVVMVLDQGEVVEIGSHDELMASRGLYHDLFTLQADRYGLTDVTAARADANRHRPGADDRRSRGSQLLPYGGTPAAVASRPMPKLVVRVATAGATREVGDRAEFGDRLESRSAAIVFLLSLSSAADNSAGSRAPRRSAAS